MISVTVLATRLWYGQSCPYVCFSFSGEWGCMATVRSAMCCFIWSPAFGCSSMYSTSVLWRENGGGFCRDAVSGWLVSAAEKLYLQCMIVQNVCWCVCWLFLWSSHRGASWNIFSPFWQHFPAGRQKNLFLHIGKSSSRGKKKDFCKLNPRWSFSL